VAIWLRPLWLLSKKLSKERRAPRTRRPLAKLPTLWVYRALDFNLELNIYSPRTMPPLTVQMLSAPHQVPLQLRHRVQLPALQLM
jgi:hypothetical protein